MKCTDQLEDELRRRLVIKNELSDEQGNPIITWISADNRLSSIYIENLISSIVDSLNCRESIIEMYGIKGINDNFVLIKVDFLNKIISKLSTTKYSKRRSFYE